MTKNEEVSVKNDEITILPPPTDPLEQERAIARIQVINVLRETDQWAARAVEDDAKMPAERIAYRQTLRALLTTISSSDDPASIEIPEAPAAAVAEKSAGG